MGSLGKERSKKPPSAETLATPTSTFYQSKHSNSLESSLSAPSYTSSFPIIESITTEFYSENFVYDIKAAKTYLRSWGGTVRNARVPIHNSSKNINKIIFVYLFSNFKRISFWVKFIISMKIMSICENNMISWMLLKSDTIYFVTGSPLRITQVTKRTFNI